MPTLLLLALLCCTGCAGALVDALEQRRLASCVWWANPIAKGVTATGGAALTDCLEQRHTWP